VDIGAQDEHGDVVRAAGGHLADDVLAQRVEVACRPALSGVAQALEPVLEVLTALLDESRPCT
jgi:hypothetical protein